MANNEFTQGVVEILLGWIRWLTSWVWDFFQADMAGGFISWFAAHWLSMAVTFMIIGLIADFIVWMIRWRPYWLWLRKRQVIYEEVPREQSDEPPAPRRVRRPRPRRHMPSAYKRDYIDPFSSGEIDPYAKLRASDADADGADDWEALWDIGDDPYAAPRDGKAPSPAPANGGKRRH